MKKKEEERVNDVTVQDRLTSIEKENT